MNVAPKQHVVQVKTNRFFLLRELLLFDVVDVFFCERRLPYPPIVNILWLSRLYENGMQWKHHGKLMNAFMKTE